MNKVDWERPLTEDEKEFLEHMIEGLPNYIARQRVHIFLGGWFEGKTLANADLNGDGPRSMIKGGRRVLYETRDLVEWAIRYFGIKRIENKLLFVRARAA
ncbi:hypothetical protein ACQ0P8_06590 [Halodesulfovibrio aestuarii]|uniref:Uncharacterized protein n=1 Tax=Halodesulfovibrio aestuarii TaxID=126333 RepID=A0A8G2CCC9_9BACT|nr:hypothetical protein [Halodesulfovibrio aestuarii]SHJ77770.1 hypothetical protein SAMN05660830_03196 [Halodesulfovibrio aestuarii]